MSRDYTFQPAPPSVWDAYFAKPAVMPTPAFTTGEWHHGERTVSFFGRVKRQGGETFISAGGHRRPLPDLVASPRSTTSSRTPGQKNEGTVYHQRRQVLTCPDCGAVRMDFDSPHAPRWANGTLVDCIGFPAEAA